MTITVDIKPEIQAELARQAAAHGRAIEAYAASLLEEAVHSPAVTEPPAFDKGRASMRGVFLIPIAPDPGIFRISRHRSSSISLHPFEKTSRFRIWACSMKPNDKKWN